MTCGQSAATYRRRFRLEFQWHTCALAPTSSVDCSRRFPGCAGRRNGVGRSVIGAGLTLSSIMPCCSAARAFRLRRQRAWQRARRLHPCSHQKRGFLRAGAVRVARPHSGAIILVALWGGIVVARKAGDRDAGAGQSFARTAACRRLHRDRGAAGRRGSALSGLRLAAEIINQLIIAALLGVVAAGQNLYLPAAKVSISRRRHHLVERIPCRQPHAAERCEPVACHCGGVDAAFSSVW